MAHGDSKDLPRRAASDKVFRDKPFNITKNPKYDGNQRELASMVYKSFEKNLLVVLLYVQINLLLKVKLCQTNN